MSTPSPWKFFSMEELSCRCGCGQMGMNADFMEKMVKLRLHFGRPLIVTSAYRCPAWDKKVSGSTRPGAGPHTSGHAVDVNVYGEDALGYIKKAQELGLFTGFGFAQKGEARSRFVHLDDLTAQEAGVPRPGVWTY
jgi:zinc D-Ala-D-Ala carboxypeptidase